MGHRHRAGSAALAVASMAMLGACGSSAKSSSASTRPPQISTAAAATTASGGGGSVNVGAGVADPQAASPASGDPDGQTPPGVPDTGRALIVTATLTLRADNVGEAVNAVTAIAVQQGGNVYNSQVNLAKPANASVEVRVPPFKLADTESAIGKLGTVLGLTQQVQDVTEASADLDARIKTAQASVDRVRGFLDKTTSLSDLAALEAQVTQRETTLEQLQAQQRTMADQTALSTLTVEIKGPDAVLAPDAHKRPSVVAGFKGGVAAIVAVVSIVGVVLAALLPFAVLSALLGAPAWLLWKRWRRGHPAQMPTTAVAGSPTGSGHGAKGGEMPPPL